MFTGLIQRTGELAEVTAGSGSGRLVLRTGPWTPPLAVGESVAVQGVCLTLTRFDETSLEFDILRETLEKTSLGHQRAGDRLNLERALRVGDPMGGHIVTGHVDGVGRVTSLARAGRDWVVEIGCEPGLMEGIVPKGSIACDGISLTVVGLGPGAFTVHVIPHTWTNTSFPDLRVGTEVNLETDVLGKYVRRLLAPPGAAGGLTWDTLRKSGFVA
jgi:riboflavin synthase